MMCARMVAADEKDLISRRTGRNVTMSGWIKIGAEFITALTHQWKGSSHPNLPSETTNSMAAEDLAPGLDSVAVRPESQISIKLEASPRSKKSSAAVKLCDIFSMIFWMSTDDKPKTFAERLNRAEDHINERLAARGETWQLDATTRKQLGLPPPRTVRSSRAVVELITHSDDLL
jgi:hypothetical protein